MEGKIQAVVFDAAGTLLRHREPVGATYARFAQKHGVDVPAGRLDEAFRRVFSGAAANVHPGEPIWRAEALEREWWRTQVRDTFRAADQMVRFDDFDAYFDELWRHFASTDAWDLAPGTIDCLDALAARGLAIGVLSNFDQRLRELLGAFELHERLDVVTTPADAGAAKPDKQIFDACLKRLGLPGHRVLYVGDHPEEDFAGARNAGLVPFDVTTLDSLAALPDRLADFDKETA